MPRRRCVGDARHWSCAVSTLKVGADETNRVAPSGQWQAAGGPSRSQFPVWQGQSAAAAAAPQGHGTAPLAWRGAAATAKMIIAATRMPRRLMLE